MTNQREQSPYKLLLSWWWLFTRSAWPSLPQKPFLVRPWVGPRWGVPELRDLWARGCCLRQGWGAFLDCARGGEKRLGFRYLGSLFGPLSWLPVRFSAETGQRSWLVFCNVWDSKEAFLCPRTVWGPGLWFGNISSTAPSVLFNFFFFSSKSCLNGIWGQPCSPTAVLVERAP